MRNALTSATGWRRGLPVDQPLGPDPLEMWAARTMVTAGGVQSRALGFASSQQRLVPRSFDARLQAALEDAEATGELSSGAARSLRGMLLHRAAAFTGLMCRGQCHAITEHIAHGADLCTRYGR